MQPTSFPETKKKRIKSGGKSQRPEAVVEKDRKESGGCGKKIICEGSEA